MALLEERARPVSSRARRRRRTERLWLLLALGYVLVVGAAALVIFWGTETIVGVIALVLAVVIGLSLLLSSEPRERP